MRVAQMVGWGEALPVAEGVRDGTNGIDYNPGSDIDTDIVTVGVTGTPRIFWQESTGAFRFTKSIYLDSGQIITFGASTTSIHRDSSGELNLDANLLRIAGRDYSGTPDATGSLFEVQSQVFTDNATAASGTSVISNFSSFAISTLAASSFWS